LLGVLQVGHYAKLTILLENSKGPEKTTDR